MAVLYLPCSGSVLALSYLWQPVVGLLAALMQLVPFPGLPYLGAVAGFGRFEGMP